MIGKLRKYLSNRTTALLYKQLVRPHLEYCDILVDSSLKKHINKFDKVQHRALRTCEVLAMKLCTNWLNGKLEWAFSLASPFTQDFWTD